MDLAGDGAELVADGAGERCPDLRETPWWRPLRVARLDPLRGTDPLDRLAADLLDAFRDQGHAVLDAAAPDLDVMLALLSVPPGPGPLRERVPERVPPLALALMREFGLPRRPDNLVALLGVDERLSDRPHQEVVETARTAMARIGAPKVVFVSGEGPDEVTYCTLEGGHPSDREAMATTLRDRLVAAACAREVGGRFEIAADAIPHQAWERTRVPEHLVAAGRRMHGLGLLPAPKRVAEYVSADTARTYERFLGLKGYSEGMLFAVDPETGTTLVTASGSWNVDKRALRRDEVTPLGGMRDGHVQVLAPEGVRPKGPSVEAAEVLALLEAVPTVRVGRSAAGDWIPDPSGPVEVPIVRAGIHVHVGVTGADPETVETVPANRRLYPYGFGCGTDLMCELAQDVARRSRAMQDPDDPRAYVRWPMLYHGEMVVELWKPGVPARTLQGVLDLFDPARRRAIRYTPDEVAQPV